MSLCWAQVCPCHSRFQPRNVGFTPAASLLRPSLWRAAPGWSCWVLCLETDRGGSATGLTECILSG